MLQLRPIQSLKSSSSRTFGNWGIKLLLSIITPQTFPGASTRRDVNVIDRYVAGRVVSPDGLEDEAVRERSLGYAELRVVPLPSLAPWSLPQCVFCAVLGLEREASILHVQYSGRPNPPPSFRPQQNLRKSGLKTEGVLSVTGVSLQWLLAENPRKYGFFNRGVYNKEGEEGGSTLYTVVLIFLPVNS